MKKVLVAIDPGVNALGWALMREGAKLAPPIKAGVFQLTHKQKLAMDWVARVAWLVDHLEEEVSKASLRFKVTRYACEWPQFQGGSVGFAAAARDDLGHLAAAVGWHACCATRRGLVLLPVPVSHWKGSLPKRVVNDRLARLGLLTTRRGDAVVSHSQDAVGIGAFAKGFPMDHKVFRSKS